MSDGNGERKHNFFVGASAVRKAFYANNPMILLLYKEAAKDRLMSRVRNLTSTVCKDSSSS